MRNTFGHIFTLTSFGESHGNAIGGVVDGMPPGILLDFKFIQDELDRRKPGQSKITTQRKENDMVEFLSGVFEGKTTGMPIAFIVRNLDQHSSDYETLKNVFRPSHADFTYFKKFGIRDYRGGGRASARENIARVVAGALAKIVLKKWNVSVCAYTSQVGDIVLDEKCEQLDLSIAETNAVRCPHAETALKMENLIENVKSDGDTVGGVISCVIKNTLIGIGEPQFNKLHADLGAAMLGINAVKGFEYGMGFQGVSKRGSEMNDVFYNDNGRISTLTNYSGGIQGGIANGQDIFFRVAFKPVATLLKQQNTVDMEGNNTVVNPKGRHDPCVLPRAVPVVEAMAAMVVLDHILLKNAYDFHD